VRAITFEDAEQLAEAMRDHDAVINAAGYLNDGASYVSLVTRIVNAAQKALGADGRFWLFGGAALLDVPGANIATLDLPGVPKIYEAHRVNWTNVKASTLDWSMLCPGPMIDAPGGKPTEGLCVSADEWPLPRPLLTRVLPRVALSLAFKQALPRMTIYYEDAAQVILDHLQRGDCLSRKRVGIALPPGMRRHKAHVPG
jgi:hypothetical protein